MSKSTTLLRGGTTKPEGFGVANQSIKQIMDCFVPRNDGQQQALNIQI